MRKSILGLLLTVLVLTGLSQTYYAVWDVTTLRYVLVTNPPGATYVPNTSDTISVRLDVPIARPDFAVTMANTAIVINVLTNDLDFAGRPLTIVSVQPTNCTAFIENNSLTYIPALNFIGTNVFGYTISDGIGNFSSANVTVAVTNNGGVLLRYPSGDVVVSNLSFSTPANNPVPISYTVITGVYDQFGDPLLLLGASGTNMTATAGATNISLTPTPHFAGTATGSYSIGDTYTLTNTGSIQMLVTNVNLATVYFTNSVLAYSTSTLIPVTLLPATNNLYYTSDTNWVLQVYATNATLTSTTNGTNSVVTFVGIPAGTNATLRCILTDGGNSATAVLTIALTNQVTAHADSYTNVVNTTMVLQPLTNDVSLDGHALLISSASATNGTLSITSGTNLTYLPATNFLGHTALSYTANDGQSYTSTTNIAISVIPVQPRATNDSYTVSTLTTNSFSVLTNDFAPLAQLTLSGYLGLTNGIVTLTSNTVVYVASSFVGTNNFGYYATNYYGQTATGYVKVASVMVPLIPIMVNNTEPSGFASSSNNPATAYFAFNGTGLSVSADTVSYSFPAPRVVVKLTVATGGGISNWSSLTLQGSSDGVIWTTLTALGFNTYTSTFVNSVSYTYYRLVCNVGAISDLTYQLYGY